MESEDKQLPWIEEYRPQTLDQIIDHKDIIRILKKFIHDDIGWNYRMTSMQAAFGLAQLENLKLFVKKKKF